MACVTGVVPDGSPASVSPRVAIIVNGRIRYDGATEEFLGTGERTTDIVVGRLTPSVAERLEQAFEVNLRGQGDRVELRLSDKHVRDALELLLGAGADVVSVTPHRASLEEIFLTAVEEGAE